MTYELEKQLGIERALVADLDIKNKSLREIAASSTKIQGDLKECLSVQKSVYEAKTVQLENSFNLKLSDVEDKLVEASQTYKETLMKLTEELKQSYEYNRRLVEEKGDLVADVEKRIEAAQTYKETLMKLTEELMTSNNRGVEALRIMKADEVKLKTLQENHKELSSELDKTIEKHAVVIQDLTDNLLRANRENGLLEVKLENTRHKGSSLDKLETKVQGLTDDLLKANRDNGLLKVKLENTRYKGQSLDKLENSVSKLEAENKAVTLKLREVVEERTDLKSRIIALRDKTRVTKKLEKVLASFE